MGAVMFDAHSMLPLPLVKQFAGYLKPDDLLFLEEAWVPQAMLHRGHAQAARGRARAVGDRRA